MVEISIPDQDPHPPMTLSYSFPIINMIIIVCDIIPTTFNIKIV